MTPVSAPDRCNVRGVTRCRQPVVNRRTNAPTLHGWLARAMMPGNQQDDAVASNDRLLEPSVNRRPCAIKVHAMEIDRHIGLDIAASQTLVPTPIERSFSDWTRLGANFRQGARQRLGCLWRCTRFLFIFRSLWNDAFPRQRSDRRRDTRPELGFLSAEAAHAQRHPWGEGSTPPRWPTYRRRSQPRPGLRPRTYRTGSGP